MNVLEITTKIGCSVSCKYCPQEKLIQAEYSGPKLMSAELFSKYLETVPPSVAIHFSGFCEPWLASEATEMVCRAKAKGHNVVVYTTLVGMKIEDLEILKTLRIKHFEVHLPDDRQRMNINVDANYLELVSRTVEIPGIVFRVVGERTTYPKIQEILKKSGVDFQVGKGIHTRGGNLNVEGFDDYEIYGRKNLRGHKVRCMKKLRANNLLPNGLVVACCQDYGLTLPVGDLTEVAYSQLFETRQFDAIKQRLCDRLDVSLICRRCNFAQVVK